MVPAPVSLLFGCLLAICFPFTVEGFSWGSSSHVQGHRGSQDQLQAAKIIRQEARSNEAPLSDVYTVVLQELQELEAEPLCHRIAARLLVNNCHLLDGQDDATVHIDSGRAARDFVDSYAASLAICDLERGSFVIPSRCFKFQESTLATLPIPVQPQLHVSTLEIDGCLKGLAQSDSAWSTWVSYRHKALRFCEAARADSDRAQDLHLYQRITKVLEKLMKHTESEVEERLRSFRATFKETSNAINDIGPRVNRVQSQLDKLSETLRTQMAQAVQESSDTINNGLGNAKNLQDILSMLVEMTRQSQDDIALSHQNAMQVATKRANNELETVFTALAAAVQSSMTLHSQIQTAEAHAGALVERQASLEVGMGRLEVFAENLSTKYDRHQERLKQVEEKTNHILEKIDSIAASATSLGNYVSGGYKLAELWPYVVFPVASLVMGSYGLQPSLGRNLWLVGLGEIAGLVVPNLVRHGNVLLTSSTPLHHAPQAINTTFDAQPFSNDLNGRLWSTISSAYER